MEFLSSGYFWAYLGAALSALLAGIGSAKGVGYVGEAATGLISEDPSKFGKLLILEALPGTQGIYGLLIAFLTILKLNIIGGEPAELSLLSGVLIFAACLPMGFVGLFSAIIQGRCAAAAVNILTKRPNEVFKGVSLAAVVETYAIFALLISFLMLWFIPLNLGM